MIRARTGDLRPVIGNLLGLLPDHFDRLYTFINQRNAYNNERNRIIFIRTTLVMMSKWVFTALLIWSYPARPRLYRKPRAPPVTTMPQPPPASALGAAAERMGADDDRGERRA